MIEAPTSVCRVGVARCDVTPPVGAYHRMWGAATHDRSTGVHRPLTATALLFAPANGSADLAACQALVALDHCLLWAPEMDELLDRLVHFTGLAREHIRVAFSHTHAAGLMGKERADMPGGDRIAPYLEEMARRIGSIVVDAHRGISPAVVTYATGRCTLAGHRDFWDDASRQFVCGFNPGAPADDSVLIARVSGSDGATRAVIVNYACHPTTLAWKNTLISPDFPGAMRGVIEGATGAPCVFLQGASGDLGPREGFVGDTRVADRNGRQLGYSVLSALEEMPPPATRFAYLGPVVSGATLGAWEHQPLDAASLRAKESWSWNGFAVELPYRADLPDREETTRELEEWRTREAACTPDSTAARDAHAMAERCRRRLTRIQYLPPGGHFPMPVTLAHMGDALWVFVEGEHYQRLQQRLREMFPGRPVLVVTLVNGSRCSYLPTATTYGKGIYQESIAVLEKGCLEKLADAIRDHFTGAAPAR